MNTKIRLAIIVTMFLVSAIVILVCNHAIIPAVIIAALLVIVLITIFRK